MNKRSPTDMNPFRENLRHQIKTLPQLGSLKKMADEARSVWATLKNMSEGDEYTFNRKHPRLLSKVEVLVDMLESGRVDPSEVEILQDEILTQLNRL